VLEQIRAAYFFMRPLKLLRSFLSTPPPYQTDFPLRCFLARYPQLERAFEKRLHRPWIDSRFDEPISGLSPGCHIGKIPHYRTGLGHMVSEWNTGLLWSRWSGIPFADCPMREPWSEFFGLHGFKDFQSLLRQRHLRLVRLPRIPFEENPADNPTIRRIINFYGRQAATLFQLYFDQNSFRQDEISNILHKKYFAQRNIDPIRSLRIPGKVNISVHIRRRNAVDMSNPKVHDTNSAGYRQRYYDLEYFLDLCKFIEDALGKDRAIFHIFSQGNETDYHAFNFLRNVRYHIDRDLMETVHNLIIGDILVISPSSLSFQAALISKAVIFAPYPFWHHIPDQHPWHRIHANYKAQSGENQRTVSSALAQAHLARQ
jgi:hypothetical protein